MTDKAYVYFLTPATIIILWWLAAGAYNSPILPSPYDTVGGFGGLINRGLLTHLLHSLFRFFIGSMLGITVGVVTGLMTGAYKSLDRLVTPTIYTLSPLPPIAWIPLLILGFGLGETPKILLIFIGCFMTMHLKINASCKKLPKDMYELCLQFGVSKPKLLLKVLLPHCGSAIVIGARISLTLSWILLVASELIVSDNGLGWILWDSRMFGRYDEMFAVMAILCALGTATNILVTTLGNRILHWETRIETT